ncbi:uncharacterized protein LOC113521690 isoform X2 [Galleria mellonella]|uniref:Glycine N-acyltransferase-like protein n=1 Tax=Galleria mellonella TaxID=7137 RepID=A0A6J3C258_GALME|nr:uncharacterized protein LOC113521690 isoform X2 [Galleria mellonella]
MALTCIVHTRMFLTEWWLLTKSVDFQNTAYEVIIQCPKNETDELAKALKDTKIINWDRHVTIPFAPRHIFECVKEVVKFIEAEIYHTIPSVLFFLDKDTLPYQDVNLPPGISFNLLNKQYIDLIDSCWPHRYPGSSWYFELLIKAKSGFGLFQNGHLISWMLINETGAITHVYTIEQYRKKGLAGTLLKLVCNMRLQENKHVLIFSVATNTIARNLYTKMGFQLYDELGWIFLKKKCLLNATSSNFNST